MMSDPIDTYIAAQTVLSDVDGAAGRLIIRGHSLDELAGLVAPVDVIRLLFDGFFADLPERSELETALGQARLDVFSEVEGLNGRTLTTGSVDAVRALIARLADGDDLKNALHLIAAPAVFTPAIIRLQKGLRPIAPISTLDHGADILRMLTGDMPSAAAVSALDTYLVTIADHGLNASTFAARVVASTRAGLTSAVLAGISALKGPLHGGAPGPIIDMLDAIGDPENARAWIEGALNRGDRIMGFGHRIYRVRDPRADALKHAIRLLGTPGNRLAHAEVIERATIQILNERKPDRSLETNVEFYTALLLEALGFPPDSFTCVFAMGRVIGWLAHAREQQMSGRLIRPKSEYIGPMPSLAA